MATMSSDEKSIDVMNRLLPEGLNSKGIYNFRLLASKMVGAHEYYAAVSVDSHVFAVIGVMKRRRTTFGYSFYTESEFPSYFKCPKSILSLLSPPADKNAEAWRQKCEENKDWQKNKNNFKKKLNDLPYGAQIVYHTRGGDTYLLEKRAPQYQLKTDWWGFAEGGRYSYVPKKNLREDNVEFMD